jgi:hypothetical protein
MYNSTVFRYWIRQIQEVVLLFLTNFVDDVVSSGELWCDIFQHYAVVALQQDGRILCDMRRCKVYILLSIGDTACWHCSPEKWTAHNWQIQKRHLCQSVWRPEPLEQYLHQHCLVCPPSQSYLDGQHHRHVRCSNQAPICSALPLRLFDMRGQLLIIVCTRDVTSMCLLNLLHPLRSRRCRVRHCLRKI